MEYLAGRTLEDELRTAGPLPVERACRIAAEIADALAAAHRAGVVHRDVKPANVMLVRTGEVERAKLLDFGVASALVGGARLTRLGAVIGTPEHMAPEQGAGAQATPAFDVYALGVLLFEMLTGAPPFSGEPRAVLRDKARVDAPTVGSHRRGLDPLLAALVDACLARDPAARPASVVRVGVQLRLLASRPAHEAGPSARRRARSIGRAWLGAVALAGSVLVGLTATAAVVVSPRAGSLASMVDPPEPVPLAFAALAPHERALPAASVTTREPLSAPVLRPARARRGPAAALLCARTRERAIDARVAHDWEGVLRHLGERGCWPDHDERDRLRIKALMELGRFDDCVALGTGRMDEQVRRWTELCRRRMREPARR
jgi:serine/threonine-protein kinase